MNNHDFVKRIILIIILTNVCFICMLPVIWKESLGWILGSLWSAGNFLWMYRIAKMHLSPDPGSTKLEIVKGFFFRYGVLLLYCVLVMTFIHPNLIFFGAGMLSAQIAIIINEAYSLLKKSKFSKYFGR